MILTNLLGNCADVGCTRRTQPMKAPNRNQIENREARVVSIVAATEYVEGGYSVGDIVTLAKALEAAGVIAIDLSGGTNETPELSRYCIQPPSFPRRFLEPYARPIKAAVTVPVIMAGRGPPPP